MTLTLFIIHYSHFFHPPSRLPSPLPPSSVVFPSVRAKESEIAGTLMDALRSFSHISSYPTIALERAKLQAGFNHKRDLSISKIVEAKLELDRR